MPVEEEEEEEEEEMVRFCKAAMNIIIHELLRFA